MGHEKKNKSIKQKTNGKSNQKIFGWSWGGEGKLES